ncbi:MAG: OadG family protein [Lachnospiraceae bacterium]|nr:OadG family protein [Lachnospiraceae bacterium]
MKKIKKLLLIFSVLTCMFALASCGDSKNEKTSYSYSESDLVTSVSQDIAAIKEFTDQQIDGIIQDCGPFESKKVLKSAMESWKTAKKDAGNIVEVYKDDAGAMQYKLTTKDDDVIIKVKIKCEKRDVVTNYTFGIVNDNLDVKEITYEAQFTMVETLMKAALNTLMGISTVILVLAFLSIVISLFKYINRAQNKAAEQKNGLDKTVVQITKKEEIAETEDNTELIAVITAAVASMEQTSTDGFVVRSIRKIPNSKWKKA